MHCCRHSYLKKWIPFRSYRTALLMTVLFSSNRIHYTKAFWAVCKFDQVLFNGQKIAVSRKKHMDAEKNIKLTYIRWKYGSIVRWKYGGGYFSKTKGIYFQLCLSLHVCLVCMSSSLYFAIIVLYYFC